MGIAGSGVLGLGVVARGLLADIADNTVRGREKLKSKPLNELSGRCHVAGPYLPLGRYSNLSLGRSSSFNFFETERLLLLFRLLRFFRHVRIVSMMIGARTARSTIGTAIAMVKVPGSRPEPELLAWFGVIVGLAKIWDTEDDDLVATFWRGACSTEAEPKGIVSVTTAITVVVLVAAGRFVTCGITEACAWVFAETVTGVCGNDLSPPPAETGNLLEPCTCRRSTAIAVLYPLVEMCY